MSSHTKKATKRKYSVKAAKRRIKKGLAAAGKSSTTVGQAMLNTRERKKGLANRTAGAMGRQAVSASKLARKAKSRLKGK